MSEIITIYSEGHGDTSIPGERVVTTSQLKLMVGDVEIGEVTSVSFGENGTLGPDQILTATITCSVKLGAQSES